MRRFARIIFANGVLPEDYLPKGSTMNYQHYVEVLDNLNYRIKNGIICVLIKNTSVSTRLIDN